MVGGGGEFLSFDMTAQIGGVSILIYLHAVTKL